MKTLLQINIKPFTVPSTVSEQEKIRAPGPIPPAAAPAPGSQLILSPRSYALSELPPSTLAELCTKFREQVFAEAGKDDPNMAPVYIPVDEQEGTVE